MKDEEGLDAGIRLERTGFGHRDTDPAALWLDPDVTDEALIEEDPLEITDKLLEIAEHPELADPLIRGIRAGRP